MPEAIPRSGDSETKIIETTKGQSRHGRSEADEPKKTEKSSSGGGSAAKKKEADKRSTQKEAVVRADEVRKNLEQKFEKDKKIPLVEFKDAREHLEAVTLIRDEKNVPISQDELARYKKFLIEQAGFTPGSVEKMATVDILLAAHEVDKQRGVADPKDSDYTYKVGSGEQKAEKARLLTLRNTVLSEDEEQLTSEKVSNLVEIEDYQEIGEKRAIGAAAAGSWSDTLPDESTVSKELGDVIKKAKRIDKSTLPIDRQAQRLAGLLEELEDATVEGKFEAAYAGPAEGVREVLEERVGQLAGAVEELRRGAAVAGVEAIMDTTTKGAANNLVRLVREGTISGGEWDTARARLEDRINRVRGFADADEPSNFKEAYLIDKTIRDTLLLDREVFDKFPEEVRIELKAFTHRTDGALARLDKKFQRRFDELTNDEQLSKAGDIDRDGTTYIKQITAGWGISPENAKQDLLQRAESPDAIRGWRAVTAAEGVDHAVRVNQLTEPPPRWQDVPKQIDHVYNYIESTDFSVDELSIYINKALGLLERVPSNIPEGREMRTRLTKELEAFRAFHSLRITLERNDMDPSDMLNLIRQYFDDETWVNFVTRFGRDERYRQFVDQNEQDVNLLDESFQLYSEGLRQDRIKMNIVEEMTRHAIENPFDGGAMRDFEKWLGVQLTPELRSQIEKLRVHFKTKVGAEISQNADLSGMSVDEVWGRKKMTKLADGRELDLLKFTKSIVQEWHTKNTLHGAFWVVSEDDLAALRDEFRDDIAAKLTEKLGRASNDEEIDNEARRRFLGKSFLDIRREQILDQLAVRLRDLGLRIIPGEGENPREVDVDSLLEAGFLESVDYNSYYLAWIMEWSNYDSIRIYSRDSKSRLRDDYDSLVFHQSTNMFFGRQIDQSWEFYHETNENRGRAKENDINRIWKQFLPGKHSWLFPQNSVITRWADFFISEEQEDDIERRTRKMMSEWDFDNEKYHNEFYTWMRNVAVRDMVESGEITFGTGAKKFSQVANEVKLRKFEFIDVYIDRTKHKLFTDPALFQDYLAHPIEGKFVKLLKKVEGFYSTRDARLFPFGTLAFRAHWEIVNKHMQRLFDVKNATSAEGEKLAKKLLGDGTMERKQSEKEKRKNLGLNEIKIGGAMGIPHITTLQLGEFFGTFPFRRGRQNMEDLRRLGYDSKLILFAAFAAGVAAGAYEMAKQFPKSAAEGLGGSR